MVADPELGRNQKTAKLRFYLKQRRYPAICKAEKEFEKNKMPETRIRYQSSPATSL